jgi:hypothetical protein
MHSADSPQSLIERCEQKLQQLTSQPAYDAIHAQLWRDLIQSARSLPMKHDAAIRQRELDIIHADQCIQALYDAISDIDRCYENLTQRSVLIDNIEFILSPKETLLLLVGKLQAAKERQVAKDAQYMMAAE